MHVLALDVGVAGVFLSAKINVGSSLSTPETKLQFSTENACKTSFISCVAHFSDLRNFMLQLCNERIFARFSGSWRVVSFDSLRATCTHGNYDGNIFRNSSRRI